MSTKKQKKDTNGSRQPFTVETVKRSAVKPHPQNPRKISPEAREKLDRGLEKYGMLEPVIANRQTRHVLGGHQRLLWLDEKHGGEEYELQVAWIDVPEREEPNILALLNQKNAQGEWDAGQLAAWLKEDALDFDLAGFTDEDMADLLGEISIPAPLEEPTRLKSMDTKPPPKMTWTLIGVPTVRFGELAGLVEQLARHPEVIVETTSNDG